MERSGEERGVKKRRGSERSVKERKGVECTIKVPSPWAYNRCGTTYLRFVCTYVVYLP